MKYIKNEGLKILIKSFLAGILIAIGGTIYLSCTNKIVGALLFAIGLFTIVSYSLNLYTGKIGYILNNKPVYLIELLITLIGNFLGTFFIGFILNYTRIINTIKPIAYALVETKINDTFLSITILSFFCGILMFLAVNGFKETENYFGKVLFVFLGVIVFILCGFEHCVANMFYISIASMWNFNSFIYMLFMILGNSLGSIFFSFLLKLIKK